MRLTFAINNSVSHSWTPVRIAINCENSRKVVTGSRIVSVRKSNMPALSKKVLFLVWCRLLRKFVGSVVKQVSSSQKCSMLLVGRVCSGLMLWVVMDRGMGPALPQFGFPQVAKGW